MLHRVILIALVVFPFSAAAGGLDDTQEDILERNAIGFARHVRECSIQANRENHTGPVEIELTFGEKAAVESAKLVDSKLRKTDIGRCITNGEHISLYTGVRLESPVVRTRSFAFHPWAGKSKRQWKSVEKRMRKNGIVKAMQACVAKAEIKRKLYFHFFIQPDGALEPFYKPSGETPGPPGPDGKGRTVNACFGDALKRLKFGKSGNKFVVSFVWGRDRKLRKFDGMAVEPLECELEGTPCTPADADADRQKLATEYIDRYADMVDCDDPGPAIKWLKEQPHVRSVKSGGCTVRLEVDGAIPTWFNPLPRH